MNRIRGLAACALSVIGCAVFGDTAPVAQWAFDEGCGDCADDANGDGLVAELGAGVRWAKGAFGTALAFDGRDESLVRLGVLPGMDGAGSWSFSLRAAWEDGADAKGIKNLITSHGWGENGLMVYVSNGRVSVRVGRKADGKWRETGVGFLSKPPTRTWKTLTATYDGTNIVTYVDGSRVESVAWREPLALKGGLDLGGWGAGTDRHRGLIDDLRFWNRALSPAEVRTVAADARYAGPANWSLLAQGVKPPPTVAWTNAYVSLAFDAHGQVMSLRETGSGRELVASGVPFVRARMPDGRELTPRRMVRRGADRLVWIFPRKAGELELSVKPFKSGWTFCVERMSVADVARLEWCRIRPSCNRWYGSLANMVSDESSGVLLRAYDLRTDMETDPVLCVWDADMTGFVGRRAGLAAGPRKDLVAMAKDMTLAAGVVHSKMGGAWSTTDPGVRRSYMFADLSLKTVDDWIDQALRAGISVIHFHAWWEWLGQYPVRKALFPNGLSDMAAAADRIHAAGLYTGMHTLTACINPYRDPWIFPKCPEDLVVDRTYTLAEPFAPDATELRVNELPWEKHDFVFTYSGRGNALRIGHEIVQYSGIRRERPYAFTGLTRGAFKTEKNGVVPAGTKCDYLHQHYIAFYPLPDSKLADRLASNVARVYNTCKMDQIYFDGAEGMGTRYGTDAMREKIVAKLDQGDHAVLTESSTHGAHNWWVRSRMGTVDYPRWAPKRFHDHHIRWCVEPGRMGNLLEPQMGWWKPRKPTAEARGFFMDEMEYFGAKNAGLDAATSIDAANVSNGPIPFWTEGLTTVLGWYERFRVAKAFAPEVRKMLAVPGDEYRLRQDAKGVWRLTKTDCHVHRVSGSAATDWRIASASAAPAAMRVEALYGAEPYDSPKGTNMLTAADVPFLKTKAAEDVKVRFAAENDPEHGKTIRLVAENRGKSAVGAWACGSRSFAYPYADFGDRQAFGFWVKGDGSGALLNVQFAKPREFLSCLSEHYVKLDFTGWRYVTLLYRERDAAEFPKHKWPYGGAMYSVYRDPYDPKHCETISLYVNDVPAGGRTDVSVSDIRALPTTKPVLKDAAVVLNGRTIAVPFREMSAGDFAEWEDGAWIHYSETGEPLARRAAPDMPSLAAGENRLSFASDGRAEVTVFAFGASRPALAALTPEMRRALDYEATMSVWYSPSTGFADVPPVAVRPGETARLEVYLHDAVKNPTLTFPAWFGLSSKSYTFPVEMRKDDRLVCRDGVHWIVFDKDRKTLAEGALPEPLPTMKGAVRIGFSSSDPSTANCRVGFVKRYSIR